MKSAPVSAGAALQAFAAELYPICRSITGAGVRKTLRLINRHIDLDWHEVPSGTKVFDWEVPLEWNIEGAWVGDAHGRRVVDFKAHNLHILNYSEPVRTVLPLGELKPRLHTMPAHEDWIPYRTSYYRRQWGFCMRHRELASLRPGNYEVVVDSSLAPGSLTYAECVLPGRTREEVLFFTHICHPSLANDNTSGMASPPNWPRGLPPRRDDTAIDWCLRRGPSARCAGCSATSAASAGSVMAWCSACWPIRHHSRISAAGAATARSIAWSNTSRAASILRRASLTSNPTGTTSASCVRPGFNLPVGRLTRSVNDGYPEYHSSADNLALISASQLEQSLEACKHVVEVLESNRRYINLSPKGEPRLGKRGLYGAMGGRSPADRERAMLWVLNQSDGSASLLDIAQRSGIGFPAVKLVADELEKAALLRAADETKRAQRQRRARQRLPAIEDEEGGAISVRPPQAAGYSEHRETKMKVVLFCGGLGTRLREHSDTIPKPLVNIGSRPVLWHLMRYYAHYGHTDFVLALGYRGDMVREYFLQLLGGHVERLHLERRRPQDRAAQPRPGRLAHHLRGYRAAQQHRPTCCGECTSTSTASRSFWPTMPTGCPISDSVATSITFPDMMRLRVSSVCAARKVFMPWHADGCGLANAHRRHARPAAVDQRRLSSCCARNLRLHSRRR